jgi:hypothetical protein
LLRDQFAQMEQAHAGVNYIRAQAVAKAKG